MEKRDEKDIQTQKSKRICQNWCKNVKTEQQDPLRKTRGALELYADPALHVAPSHKLGAGHIIAHELTVCNFKPYR